MHTLKLWKLGTTETENVELDIDKNTFLPKRCARLEEKQMIRKTGKRKFEVWK